MSVGKSILRVDAYDKVTGRAMYTDDLAAPGMLVGKVVRSTIANGLVKSFDLQEALAVPGVVKILTCFDAPAIDFPTAGHPWSTDPGHQDVQDRRLLNRRVRIHGDDIAVVHPPAIADLEVGTDVAPRQRGVGAQLGVAGRVVVEVVDAEQVRVDRRPLEPERERLQDRVCHGVTLPGSAVE